mmetsp:Transcript_39345/g.59132  ORF Transcript_39345/g.59132 Transcript_39345/m.59132 type:complete len:85 (-) Transcript_39345:2329-2583(-)
MPHIHSGVYSHLKILHHNNQRVGPTHSTREKGKSIIRTQSTYINETTETSSERENHTHRGTNLLFKQTKHKSLLLSKTQTHPSI